MSVRPTSLPKRAFRLARGGVHLARGMLAAAFLFPFLARTRKAEWIRLWSAGLLEILALRLEVNGTPPARAAGATMIVANHISWLDVYAINAVHAVRFVAKSEVRGWPLIGWLCAQAGTLFIERASRYHSARVNHEVAAALNDGDMFAVFPEGTTSNGRRVFPFHAALLQPVVACDGWLHPVALRYTRVDGSLCSEADYQGEKSILDTLLAMAGQPEIRVQLTFLPRIACAGRHRRELAYEAAAGIAAAIGVPAPQGPWSMGAVARGARARPGETDLQGAVIDLTGTTFSRT